MAAAGNTARQQSVAEHSRMTGEIAQLTSQVEGLLLSKVELERYVRIGFSSCVFAAYQCCFSDVCLYDIAHHDVATIHAHPPLPSPLCRQLRVLIEAGQQQQQHIATLTAHNKDLTGQLAAAQAAAARIPAVHASPAPAAVLEVCILQLVY